MVDKIYSLLDHAKFFLVSIQLCFTVIQVCNFLCYALWGYVFIFEAVWCSTVLSEMAVMHAFFVTCY